MDCWINTFSGRKVNPLNLQPEDIDIFDIAHSLACTNRFAGHTMRPISVAQHSVYVSYLCPGQALQALLHDASEAYLGDITKWLKATPAFEAYRQAEERVQRLVFERYGCDVEQHPNVEEADRLMVRFEFEQSFPPFAKIDHPNYPPISDAEHKRIGPWTAWDWRHAEKMFLARFREARYARFAFGVHK